MAKSKLPVIVSGRAEGMLLKHVEFLSRVSVPAARKLHSEFKRSLKGISSTPIKYPYLDEDGIPLKLYRKCLFFERYQIIFVVIDNVVYIDAVHDCRQDPQNRLGNM